MYKKAIFLVHFGTTHDDTRNKTIEKLNEQARQKYEDYDFFEAYTSRMILKKLSDRGMIKNTPSQVMEKLVENSYEEVLVLPSYIISGMEYETLKQELAEYENHFKSVIFAKPLLEKPGDYKIIVDTFKDIVPKKEDEALVLVCHGTDSPIGACYTMLEYMFSQAGMDNVYTVSTKAFPLIEDVIIKMKRKGIKSLIMTSFMFVAGEHAKNDMAVDFKEEFEANNIEVREVIIKGLGEYQEIRDIYLSHMDEAIKKKASTLLDFKKSYTKKYLEDRDNKKS